jgi:hypothetical protein
VSKVTDLRERRIEHVADELEPYLRRGHMPSPMSSESIPPASGAAERLGPRRNGWLVRTGMSGARAERSRARVDPELEASWKGALFVHCLSLLRITGATARRGLAPTAAERDRVWCRRRGSA